jgi:hypothetical protein
MYEQLLHVLQKSSVGRGEFRLLQPANVDSGNSTNQNVVLIQWRSERNAFDVAMINLAGTPSQCNAALEVENFAANDWIIEDLLQSGEGGLRIEVVNGGVRLDLPPHTASLLRFRKTG